MSNIYSSMSITTTQLLFLYSYVLILFLCSYITAASLLLELAFWPKMKTKEKKQKQQNSDKATTKNKQTKNI